MAHELTITNGVAEMAYVGETPWHGLGQELEAGASLDTWLQAAGMSWNIRRADVMYTVGRGASKSSLVVPDQQVLYRHDTGAPLGIVSPKYEIVQPRDVLEFFRDLTDAGGFQLHTAGTLFGGKRFWALAKVDDVVLAKADRVGGYVLLTSSADGSTATEARETTVRVVCNNTLTMALNAKAARSGVVRVSHRSVYDAAFIKANLGATRENFQAFAEAANALTKMRVSTARAESFVAQLLTGDEDKAKDVLAGEARRPKGLDTILALFDGAGRGAGLASADGTMWGLVNAVTEYVDHHGSAKTESHRLARSWFGDGADLKAEALELALADF